MDLKTTAQQDFVAFKCEKTKTAKYEKEDTTRVLKFAGVSQYRSEFPDWGNYEFIHIGSFRKAFMNPNVKLSPVTTYTQNFCQGNKISRTQSQKKLQSPNPVTACMDFFGQTTSRENFKGFKNNNFPERVKNKAFGILPLESPAKCYKTLYTTDFASKTSPQVFMRKKDMPNAVHS